MWAPWACFYIFNWLRCYRNWSSRVSYPCAAFGYRNTSKQRHRKQIKQRDNHWSSWRRFVDLTFDKAKDRGQILNIAHLQGRASRQSKVGRISIKTLTQIHSKLKMTSVRIVSIQLILLLFALLSDEFLFLFVSAYSDALNGSHLVVAFAKSVNV